MIRTEISEEKKEELTKQTIPTSNAIGMVLTYLHDSEMGGCEDRTDPWYPTYESLQELLIKVLGEEEI